VGYDATCTLKYEGKTSRGTAWLEQKDLIFRGPVRLAIPFTTITSATAHDGTLHVQFGERRADFAIGDAAEKWAKRITNPPSRLDKLGVKPGMTVSVIGISDKTFLEEVKSRTAKVTRTPPSVAGSADLLFYEATHRDALQRLRALATLITPRAPSGSCGRRDGPRLPKPRRWRRGSVRASSTSRS